MLILSRKVDERIIIGDDILVSIVDIKGDQVKLGIQAPKEIKVYRQEVYDAIQKENLAAARAGTVLPEIKRLAGKKRRAVKDSSKWNQSSSSAKGSHS
jgi:carbon storage regulator